MTEPLVTIYITNYNYEKYLKQAIESVLSQTYQSIELLIIDDGSTDNSRDIIEQYSNYEKVQVVYQTNKGLNITNNIALRLAHGKYIMRLDADDYLAYDAVAQMVAIMENDDNLGLIFPDYYLVNEDGTVTEQIIRHDFDNEVSLLDQPAHGACTMIRTEFLRNTGGYNENYNCQDGYELWIKFTLNYPVKNINKPLFYYRQHGHNLTSNEQRILGTRAAIHQEHINKKYKDIPTIAIIPVRGQSTSKKSVAHITLADQTILERKVNAALNTKYIKKIIISSPDEYIAELVNQRYTDYNEVVFHKRNIKEARMNTNLNNTIKEILQNLGDEVNEYQALSLLYIEYPFIKSATIDDAINAMFLFGSDSLISVRQDNSMFFQHHGDGMKAILNQDKFTKLERESLYRLSGGINVAKIKSFQEAKKMMCGKIGHIEITREEAIGLHTKYDVEIAELIVSKKHQIS